MPEQDKRRLAVLIDGDNAQHRRLKLIFEVIKLYGIVTDGRAYGDWTTPYLANWQQVMLDHAIQPVQQWQYTYGKNASDIALVIDAMDILHKGTVQGFVIVASDSDYTRLCMRIREEGLFVMGIGKKQTPDAFINSCDRFFFVEDIHLKWLLFTAFARADKDPNGWARLGEVGKIIGELDADFNTQTYGFTTLTALFQAYDQHFAVENGMVNYARNVDTRAIKSRKRLLARLETAFTRASVTDTGWTLLSELDAVIRQLEPHFDPTTYGYTTLTELFEAFPWQFVVREGVVNRTSKAAEQRKALGKLLEQAFDGTVKQIDGWTSLSAMGETLRDMDPDFKITTYGYRKLTQAIEAYPDYFLLEDNMVKHVKFSSQQTMERHRNLLTFLDDAFDHCANGNNQAHMGAMGQYMSQIDSNFKKTYGYASLAKMVEAFPHRYTRNGHMVRRKKS